MKTITEYDPSKNTYRVIHTIPDVEIMFRPDEIRRAVFDELTKIIAREVMSKINITYGESK